MRQQWKKFPKWAARFNPMSTWTCLLVLYFLREPSPRVQWKARVILRKIQPLNRECKREAFPQIVSTCSFLLHTEVDLQALNVEISRQYTSARSLSPTKDKNPAEEEKKKKEEQQQKEEMKQKDIRINELLVQVDMQKQVRWHLFVTHVSKWNRCNKNWKLNKAK